MFISKALQRKFIVPPLYRMFSSQKESQVMYTTETGRYLDLSALDNPGTKISGIVIVNNILNEKWLAKGLNCCNNVVIADGGANKLYDTKFRDVDFVRSVVGDFDSIKPEVRKFYEQKGAKFIKIEDQNYNDFQKAVIQCINSNWNKLFIFGAFGGRMDHSLANLSNTNKMCNKFPQLDIALVGRQNLMYMIRPGIKNIIKISDSVDRQGCGLIRFGDNVNVKTKGLKYNMGPAFQFSELGWGDFVSTSNQIIGDQIQIETDGDLFFVAHIASNIKN